MESKANAVSRIVEIIGESTKREQPVAVSELIYHSDIAKPTYHRLVQQLDEEGFLTTDQRGNLYPGAALRNIALNLAGNNTQRAQLQAILHGLSRRIDETCGIAVPDGDAMVYQERIETNWPLRIVLPVGMRTPVWATASGKLLLSTLNKAQRDRLFERTPIEPLAKNTHRDRESLEAELRQIRSQQVSVDNEEFIDGLVAVAIPLFSPQGKLLASLFCHCPKTRKSLSTLLSYLPDLERAREQLLSLYQLNDDNN
ncbi:IclR family transcriptional regulator [Vibrio fluvialis]|nr:IclR family transcriptional regulator [Vibrio fluvialis]